MATKLENLSAVLTTVERTPERSPLFWWLVKHHDELVAAADGNRMRWAPLCARFAALGLTDTTGKHATPRGAREAWLQARTYVSKRRAAKQAAAAPKLHPSRLPANWQPQPAPPPPMRPPDTVPHGPDGLSRAEANIAAVRRFIKSRSG